MKKIPEFEGYFAKEDGTIWSLKYGSLKEIKPYKEKSGYLGIKLRKDNKTYSKRVHRLIALTYLIQRGKDLQVNHINGIKDDNRVTNLEWVTPSENIRHSIFVLGNKPNFSGIAGANRKKVELICIKTGNCFLYDSSTDAAKEHNLLQPSIHKACKGILQQTGGYKARYV